MPVKENIENQLIFDEVNKLDGLFFMEHEALITK